MKQTIYVILKIDVEYLVKMFRIDLRHMFDPSQNMHQELGLFTRGNKELKNLRECVENGARIKRNE